MPDFPDRAAFEKKLASSVGSRFSAALQKLSDVLGDPPSMDNVPNDLWDEIGADLVDEMEPQLAQTYANSAVHLGNDLRNRYQVEVGRSVDWKLVNKSAAEWAKQYTYELVKGIDATSRDRLSGAISSFFEDQLSMGDLRDLIGSIFDPERAARIATTEITRAAVEGELNTVNWIEEDSDIRMVPTWATSEDEHVCDICDPRDGTTAEEGGWMDDYPPAHVSCRCWINWAPEGWE